MSRFLREGIALSAVALAACATRSGSGGYGAFHRPITTASPTAQSHFDAGLLLCYGFNHEEAVREFEAALRDDPHCAMASWGIAYALGPNINLPLLDKAAARRAYDCAQQALAAAKERPASEVESALLAAMAARYSETPPDDRTGLDRAYADAMRGVYEKFPQDADVGALYAESLLDLSPWDQWEKSGKPRPNTTEILAALEHTIAEHRDHPGALHFYIHATEASPEPKQAADAAARLGALAPGCGHLVHMPAHTFARLGRYTDALAANLAGIDADRAYFRAHPTAGIYHMYLAHNQHFAAWSAMYLGASATALRCAREMVADLPPSLREQTPQFVDGFLAVPLHVLIRFGRWEEILHENAPGAPFPVATALWHYARGIACANLDRIEAGRQEQAEFERVAATVGADATVGLTPARDVLAVAREMLAGELAFRGGDHAEGLAHLRAAAVVEDALRYDEPSGWMQPVRHALGALLLESDDVKGAETAYREDLQQHPDNGWSLHGLAECQRRRGDPAANATDAAFKRAWAHADVPLHASCFCRR